MTTVDSAEISRFEAMAAQWWDPAGPMKPLHRFNPARLKVMRDWLTRHFQRDSATLTPFAGLSLVDIGCGGGLISEPMARLGARVTGIDAAEKNARVAATHAHQSGLTIDYRHAAAEDLAAAGETFDIVLALEVIEHVSDVHAFLAALAKLLKPGGVMIIATLNRTPQAYALAILGAEYIMRWLPVGTHQWSKFVRPSEIAAGLRPHGLTIKELTGLRYSPFADTWSTGRDMGVNYMALVTA